jgi:hypothetical protein
MCSESSNPRNSLGVPVPPDKIDSMIKPLWAPTIIRL